MNSYGFPNLLQFSRLNGAIADLKAQSEKARVEIVTGRASDLKQTLKGAIGEAHILRQAIDQLADLKLSATRGLSRAAVTQLVLNTVAEPAATRGAELLNALGFEDEAGISLAGAQARQDVEAAIAGFNQRHEGRALFAGDETDQTALADPSVLIADVATLYSSAADAAQFEADLEFYFNDPAGGFALNIYGGGSGDAPRAEIAIGELAHYSAKADEQPVRDLLRSLASIAVAAEAGPSPDRNEILSVAATGLIEAGAGITEIRARVGAAEARLQSGLDRIAAEEPILTAAYNEMTAIDPFETAARLQQLETQLQTSFILTARISQLSFANFIR